MKLPAITREGFSGKCIERAITSVSYVLTWHWVFCCPGNSISSEPEHLNTLSRWSWPQRFFKIVMSRQFCTLSHYYLLKVLLVEPRFYSAAFLWYTVTTNHWCIGSCIEVFFALFTFATQLLHLIKCIVGEIRFKATLIWYFPNLMSCGGWILLNFFAASLKCNSWIGVGALCLVTLCTVKS